MKNFSQWLAAQAIIEQHGKVTVVRDDLLSGGSKTRFLPYLIEGADEVVFGGPFCGGAPFALSILGKHAGFKVSLFYAKRNALHRRQLQALKNGAKIYQVPHGRMSNVQAKARRYADKAGALFLPLGFDVPAAQHPFVEAMENVRRKHGPFDQVWAATGSGMLARCLGLAFPDSEVHGVCVGLQSRHSKQKFSDNVTLHNFPLPFENCTAAPSPFPSCGNYDRKAWEMCEKISKGRALFWNVLG